MQHVQARRAAETVHCICSAADCGWSSLAELVLVIVIVIVIVIVFVLVVVLLVVVLVLLPAGPISPSKTLRLLQRLEDGSPLQHGLDTRAPLLLGMVSGCTGAA